MKPGFIVARQVASLALAGWAGYHIGSLSSAAELAKAEKGWATERAELAGQRADAINARLIAEHKQAEAIHEAAQNYEKGKADAEEASKQVVAGVRSGALRLRDQWATCRATVAAVSSAASGRQPDAAADDRAASAGRIVRAAAQCDAQVRGLQQALIGERK